MMIHGPKFNNEDWCCLKFMSRSYFSFILEFVRIDCDNVYMKVIQSSTLSQTGYDNYNSHKFAFSVSDLNRDILCICIRICVYTLIISGKKGESWRLILSELAKFTTKILNKKKCRILLLWRKVVALWNKWVKEFPPVLNYKYIGGA